MKFGKEFKTHLEETLPEWRDKFLCYKPLKKLLKHFPLSPDDDRSRLDALLLRHPDYIPQRQVVVAVPPGGGPQPPLLVLQDWFLRILNEELEKFNDFYVDKEEEFVIRLQELKMRIEGLKEKSSKNGVFSSESEFSEEMMDIRKDLVTIHGEMVLLKNYSSLNFAGLVKILKKYDKRTGGLLRLPFTQLVLHQPFFTTEPLTRLVHECEANLELLFPLEAEVVQSSSPAKPQSNQPSTNMRDISHESSSLDNQTVEIYRSTLAAMKAIKGLQKASSTQNPLSFSSIFKRQEDDNSGGVVTDYSASNSPGSMQDTDEADQKVVHSE